ncbi:hypothetical protein T459_32570 [Capsicum annuum]|uniref:histidine--tRNA ligase n=1 Tax=Capsicum annuum TaxID=4072 RepID=A0A2G2Y1X2_CAPAN|nr:hypothetical protein T459_32570 [Capsicum annuum]
MLKEKGFLSELNLQIENIVCSLDKEPQGAVSAVATILREKGQSVDLVLENKPLKVFKRAAHINARRLILVRKDKWQKGMVNGKTLSTGEQLEIKLDELKNIKVIQDAPPFVNPIDLLINEAFGGLRHEGVNTGPSQVAGEEETLHDLSDSNNKDYFELLKEGSKDLYEGSKAYEMHAEDDNKDGILRHPRDSEAYKNQICRYLHHKDTPHPSPIVCLESQPSLSVHLTSHPSPVGRDSSQPSRSVHSTSYLGLANQDSSQSSRSFHSTSHLDPTNEDSSQAAPTDQAAPKKILHPSDASSGPISPMDARRPRDDSDPNDGH